MANELMNYNDLPCCPQLDPAPVCDVIDFRRRLVFATPVRGPREQPVKVEVVLHTRFTRCPGPLALGEIAYSTTLLPGEKVRLATTDRRSRFSFDSESKLSYRSEQISEEQYRLRALRAFMSDENVVDRGSDHYSEQGKWDFHGDASGSLGFFSASADTNARGSHSASSTRDYLREHRAHAEMSDHQSVEATRRAHSVSIGEVQSRSHVEGESEDHFESASREFVNPNKCHAVTFMFYRLNKTETIRFELVAVERRVLDPATPTPVAANPFRSMGQVATIPQELPATHAKRVETLDRGIEADQQMQLQALAPLPGGAPRALLGNRLTTGTALLNALGEEQPLPDDLRQQALKFVDAQLQQQGLLGPDGQVSREVQEQFGYERRTSLPTAGVIVKSCMDDCGICEPEVERMHELEVERMALQNELLKRQIELLDKSAEYRCCPAGMAEPTP
ncbi:hypothetical protein [Ideonella sp. BN130291]|uniref:hypothetical protein n=1 Tax=Ideonella sp. BN130291 TaxID=3112940 RepID=UPI002E26FC50|nr:hypothetical protein [Ideonella sp. BN130291]